MASEIRLLVKNAGQAKDFPILLANTATIGDLKGELQRSYPSHPNPAQQKLIFAGRLLNDDAQSLAQLITTSKYDISATQTVHLVLPPTLSSSTSGIPSPTVNRIQTQPELRRSAPAGFGSPVAVPHQLPAIHGQPHPRYVPGNGIQPPFPRPAAAAAIPDGPALPQPAAAPAPAQPQQPAAPGFLGRQNWMLMLKLVVIIYIFSQGGGSTRLALLSFGAFIIYLYHMGLIPAIRFTIRRAVAPPVAEPAEQRADDQPQQREEAQEEEAAPAVAAATTEAAQQPPAAAAAAVQRVGLWRELENLFLPFVYSLIPTWQPDQAVRAVPAAVHPHQD